MTKASTVATDRYDRRKLLYHPRAVASLIETGDCWPVTVNTGFTTYCNHSCVWCSSAYTTRVTPSLKTRDELIVQPEVWLRAIGELAAGGTRGLVIAGQGEPLLHPAATRMLDGAAAAGLRYMLFTNGERMLPDVVDSLFRGAVAIRFSLDAASRDSHRRWHAARNQNGAGRADFERVVANIRHLVAEKRRRGSTLPDIGCQMICSSLTEPDFEAFAALCRDIGVDYVAYKSLQGSRANEGIVATAQSLHLDEAGRARQAAGMVATLTDIKKRYETEAFAVHVKVDQIGQAYVHRFNGATRYATCRAHPLTPMIEPDGKVYLCIDHGGEPDFVIGNIYDHGFGEIWRSPQRRDAIARIDLEARCPAGCNLDETNMLLADLADPDPHHHHVLI